MSTILLSEQFQSDSADIIINLSVLVLIIALSFMSYHTFLFYQKNRLIQKEHRSREKEKIKNSLKDATYLLNESKEFIDVLKKDSTMNAPTIETYRVQNLLNEVYGLMEPLVEENNIEFVYDIDSSIPIELVGDSLLLEQALYALLSQILSSSYHSSVNIHFEQDKEQHSLIITITVLPPVSINDIQLKETQTHLHPLNATLVQNTDEYKITLPFLTSPLYHESYYTLPDNISGKKVLIVTQQHSTSLAIKKSLEHFGLIVHTKKATELTTLNNLDEYDIFMVDIHLLSPTILYEIEEIKNKKNFHLISLEQFFGQRDRRFKPHKLVSKYLYTPISMGMIFGLLYELYIMGKTIHTYQENKKIENDTDVVFIEEMENITQESFQDFNTIHILVVEDNKINQKIIQSVLQKSNIDISIANNGQEALAALEDNINIDIVLMDINMPIMDGYQATKHIRKNNKFTNLPIVILSSLGFRNEIEQMYRAGANAHLTKPFKIGQLYAVFHMFLHKEEKHNKTTNVSSTYRENKELLDTKEGAIHTQNIIAYRDQLRETLVIFSHSDDVIKEYIIKKNFTALSTYCEQTLAHSTHIGTNYLSQILKEMIILINDKEVSLLPKYIVTYEQVWVRTKREIEHYLKSVNAL